MKKKPNTIEVTDKELDRLATEVKKLEIALQEVERVDNQRSIKRRNRQKRKKD